MQNRKLSNKFVINILIFAVLGGVVGMFLAPENTTVQFVVIGAVVFSYMSIMFRRTPHVSYTSSFAGWFLGGAVVGLFIGIMNENRFLDIVNEIMQFAMIGVLFAIVDNFTRAWR